MAPKLGRLSNLHPKQAGSTRRDLGVPSWRAFDVAYTPAALPPNNVVSRELEWAQFAAFSEAFP
jgi:hypothetical protein